MPGRCLSGGPSFPSQSSGHTAGPQVRKSVSHVEHVRRRSLPPAGAWNARRTHCRTLCTHTMHIHTMPNYLSTVTVSSSLSAHSSARSGGTDACNQSTRPSGQEVQCVRTSRVIKSSPGCAAELQTSPTLPVLACKHRITNSALQLYTRTSPNRSVARTDVSVPRTNALNRMYCDMVAMRLWFVTLGNTQLHWWIRAEGHVPISPPRAPG